MRTDSVWLGVAEGADEPLSPCYTSSSISHMPRTPASAVIVATSSLGSRRERRDQGHGPEFSTSNASGRDVRWSPAPARRDSLRSAGPVGGAASGKPAHSEGGTPRRNLPRPVPSRCVSAPALPTLCGSRASVLPALQCAGQVTPPAASAAEWPGPPCLELVQGAGT